MSATITNTTPSSAGSPHEHPRYYVVYPGIEACSEASTTAGNDQGYTMYQALATMVIGDPSKHPEIRNVVLRFVLRVRANSADPLHSWYLEQEVLYRQITGRELFAILDCPDVLPPNEPLCQVIARALKVQMRIYKEHTQEGELRQHWLTAGPDRSSRSCALLETSVEGRMASHYSALLPDESGKELVEFLLSTEKQIESECDLPAWDQTYAGLPLKQISWAWDQTAGMNASCFNEFRADSKPEHLKPATDLTRMDTFVTLVNEPRHVEPALKIFHKALKLAPNQQQDVKVGPSFRIGQLRPHCSADGEFVKLPRELAAGKGRRHLNRMIADGDLEELCSVFTVSVGKHFSLVVSPVQMLENANEDTVPALRKLFKETIFDPKILKFWWNLQSDFLVLDNTIAHMYQGTARPPFWYKPNRFQQLPSRTVTPIFRIKNSHLNGVRPDDMKFPKGKAACDIHSSGTNERGMACPCQLGNIDIAALLGHFCRLHGFIDITKESWTGYRDYFNYGQMIGLMLKDNRLLPFLQYMKDRADRSPLGKDAFYQSLGDPNMEMNDDAMGYATMDCLALNIVMEQLFGRHDMHFTAYQLASFHDKQSNTTIYSANIKPPLPQQISIFKAAGEVQLFDDNPKRFVREPFFADYANLGGRQRSADRSILATATLAPWQHDQRVKVMRQIATSNNISRDATPSSIFAALPEKQRQKTNDLKTALPRATMDPLQLWVPETCARTFPSDHADSIVRARTTHAEALLDFLQSPHCKGASPPPGFGMKPGSGCGLPLSLNRIPGAGLELGRNMFNVLEAKKSSVAHPNGNILVDSPPTVVDNSAPDYKSMVDEQIQKEAWAGGRDVWFQGRLLRANLLQQIDNEKHMNQVLGLPTTVDPRDLFDPEGREYRRRVGATPSWNRPTLADVPALNADGSWKSKATEMLKVLPKDLDEDGHDWQEAGRSGRPFKPPVSYATVSSSKWDASWGAIRE